jgi:MFS transporter, DHA2 family, multidrug resistance protein
LVAIAIGPAGCLQGMDTFATAVAMPRMMGSLSATIMEISWVLTAYLVASAMFTPLYAWLSRKVGIKRMFLIVIVGFIACSIMVSQADSIFELVVFRFVQGSFGAGINPLSIQVVLAAFPTSHHGPAFGWLKTGRNSAIVLGPLIGGILTEVFDWRVVYLMNVPFGILAFVLIQRLMPSDRPQDPKRFDFFGFFALSIAIAFIQLMLNRGAKMDWFDSQAIITYTLIGLAAFYVFLIHSATALHPYLNLRVFKNRDFTIAVIFGFFANFLLYGYAGLLPPILQQQLGYPVIEAGMILTNRGVGSILASLMAGALMLRFHPRLIIAISMLFVALSTGLLSTLTPTTDTLPLSIAIFLQGFGLGAMSTAIMTAAFQTLPASLRADGASIMTATRRIASSVGISVLVATLVRSTQTARSALSENVSEHNEIFRHFPLPDKWTMDTVQGVVAFERVINKQAEFMAYLYDFELMTIITICAMPLLLLMRTAKKT